MLELLPYGGCCLTLSHQSLALHGAGGAPHWRVRDTVRTEGPMDWGGGGLPRACAFVHVASKG